MELEIIKKQTTWNDAAASLNNNFGKISRAVRDGIPVVNTPVDEEMSDTSTNAVQNKVIKKYIDDYDVYLEGYAEGVANDAEDAAKKYTDEKIAQIEIEGGGFKYFEERTVYPTKQVLGEDVFESEITDEQRAYNAETVAKALGNDGKGVIISFSGMLLQTVASESNDSYAEVLFSLSLPYYTETVRGTLKITSSGDATFEITIEGGISQENADKRYIRKVVDNFDSDLTFAVADGIVGTDDEYYFLPEKAPSTASDSQILATKADVAQGGGGGGSIDPALLEGYMPMMREFSDDFNNDFSR